MLSSLSTGEKQENLNITFNFLSVAFIFQPDIMCHSFYDSVCWSYLYILMIIFFRITMRRCHNALDQTRQFGESKMRLFFKLH